MHGVTSARLTSISMKVFLIIKLSEAPLSIRVLATLWHPIRILTRKGRIPSDSSASGWSSGLNEMSISDHLILHPGSICWARLISHWSFFPYVLEVRDMLPPKIILISPSAHLHQNCLDDDHLTGVPTALVLLRVASSSDPRNFALLQIMPRGAVNLTPLLCVIGTPKMSLLFLLRGLLTVASVVSLAPAIAPISYVDLGIILLL
jgi:hypothetical protein